MDSSQRRLGAPCSHRIKKRLPQISPVEITEDWPAKNLIKSEFFKRSAFEAATESERFDADVISNVAELNCVHTTAGKENGHMAISHPWAPSALGARRRPRTTQLLDSVEFNTENSPPIETATTIVYGRRSPWSESVLSQRNLDPVRLPTQQ